MDSSRKGLGGQAPVVEKDEEIYKRLKEEVKTKPFKEKKKELEKLKKELEKSIAKNTGLLVRAWTNPELSNLQMKLADSISRKEVVERELKILDKMKLLGEFFAENPQGDRTVAGLISLFVLKAPKVERCAVDKNKISN